MVKTLEYVSFPVEPETAAKVAELASQYRMSIGGFYRLLTDYYFGDGGNHLNCEFCGNLKDGTCRFEQETEVN